MAAKKRERAEKNAMRHARNLRRQEEKREKADALLEARSKLSPWQQMERLDWRLGFEKGAKKERARLTSSMRSPTA
jgi:hypothetical protein